MLELLYAAGLRNELVPRLLHPKSSDLNRVTEQFR